jgi:hypothetical protein
VKKTLFVILGIFFAAMAIAAVTSAARHHGDWIELIIAIGFVCLAGRTFQAARRTPYKHAPRTTSPDRRPWER